MKSSEILINTKPYYDPDLGKADLHIHTNASDGGQDPEQVLRMAVRKGLKTVSITDHDTIQGYLSVRDKAEGMGLQLISGVEVSCLWNRREIHILAYNFDAEDPGVVELLFRQSRARKKRMKQIVAYLQGKGVDIEYDEVMAEAYGGNVGRPHAAVILVKKGYAVSVQDAFIRYLSNEGIREISTDYAPLDSVLETFKEAGGVLSVAHPGPVYSDSELIRLIGEGMDGIECIHPSHNFDKQKRYTEIAASNHLLITGGSDFHGHGSTETSYEPYLGTVAISNKHVEALLRLSENRRLILKN